ncbi:MAG: T9SS C-terminal target domain-containing protein [Calditrichaeota bacterium]|nr:MAG: T9SS C-terminal target domain-containing protein [Calditrichota bacterium]
MKAKAMIRVTAAVGLGLILLGFHKHKKVAPEELGFFRAQVDEQGLVELAVDRIRQQIKSGGLALPSAKAAAAKPGMVEGAARGAVTDLKTEQITIDRDRAVYRGRLTEDGGTSGQPVQLVFERRGQALQLVEASGLGTPLLSAGSRAAGTVHPTLSGFTIYREENGAASKTFIRRRLDPDLDLDRLTRRVTLARLDRRLFQTPYAGVLFSAVTQMDRAPFFSARYVQLVTDPGWNRIVYGDYDGWIKAYGNSGRGSEDLNRPHGIDRDTEGRIYVADTGNNRIVVLRLEGKNEETELKFVSAFGADLLVHPYDVAWDDAGTPFDGSDDRLWVADTENDRILGFTLEGSTASLRYTFGGRGSGEGRFLQPRAVAVGRFNGTADGTLYVADTGNRRIVKLVVQENGLVWQTAWQGKAESQFTSLDVDHWGNVYATDRSYVELHKLTPELQPLAVLQGKRRAFTDPLNFQVVFGQVYLQSEDKRIWAGYDQGFLLEKWTDTSGAERYQLGLDLEGFRVNLSGDLARMRVASKLTDNAKVTLVVTDQAGRTVRQMPLGWLVPGDKETVWDRRDDLGWQVAPGIYRLQLQAESSYGTLTVTKETAPFYLPLYYHEDSGSDAVHDPHLVQGERSAQWGSAAVESIAKHPSEVVYRFSDLNPNVDYEIKTQFFNKVGDYLKQQLVVDGTPLAPEFEVPAGIKTLGWLPLPEELIADGEVEIRIVKTAGDLDAMVSQLWIREANFDPANPPVVQEKSESVPERFTLAQNYPNPFNPTTTIEFGVPEGAAQTVTLRIFNVRGQTVRELVNGQFSPGRHSVVWNGHDDAGRQSSSGVYFYRLHAGDVVQVKKMILMK